MRNCRGGITLVECLVVVTIVAMLLALLLPAVQSARRSARRTACQNNLHQVALALQEHESRKRMLPGLYNGSFLPQPRNALDEFHFLSWRSAILAELEQTSVLASLNQALPATDPANQAAVNAVVSTLVCPSTANVNATVPDIYGFADGKPSTRKIGTAARSDYEAVGGIQASPMRVSSADLSVIKFGAWGEPAYDPATGQSRSYRKARLADITDGLANTILVGERSGRPDIYERGQLVESYPYDDPNSGPDIHQAAWGISTHFWWIVWSSEPAVNETNRTSMYGFHAGGANAAFADGSVRFLPDSIPSQVLSAMATRAEGDDASGE